MSSSCRYVAQVGIKAVMVAHAVTLDVPNHANSWLLQRVLRQVTGLGGKKEKIKIKDLKRIGH